MQFSEKTPQVEEVYEAPQVIFEGEITARAGSPIGSPVDGVGVDLFGE
jgi:hypothetical protein